MRVFKFSIGALLALSCVATSGPAVARFVSVDPVQANPNNGANFNRYSYANNNPYKFTDPDGRDGVAFYANPQYQMAQPSAEAVGQVMDFVPVTGDVKGGIEAFRNPTPANVIGAVVGLVPGLGDVAGKLIKNADQLIEGAGKLERLKGGVLQGRIQGNAEAIVSSITEGGEKIGGNRVKMPDGTIIGTHTSKKTGVTTIDVNRNGKVHKIRVDEEVKKK